MTTLHRTLRTGLQRSESFEQFRLQPAALYQIVGIRKVLFKITSTLNQGLMTCIMCHTELTRRN